MKTILAIAVLLLFDMGIAFAQVGNSDPPSNLTLLGVGGATSPYTGPGDLVTFTAWYGLRAYSAAFAASRGAAVNLRRASDSTQQDIDVLTTGALDVASADTFAGIDATCTSATAVGTTTLALSGCSSTPHASSTITGTVSTGSLNQPVYLSTTSCGTFTGGAGTCTMATAQTFSLSSITFQYGLFITEKYDQSGADACSSAPCNASQGTPASQPQFLPSCVNGLPCSVIASGQILSSGGTLAAQNIPNTLYVVANRLGNLNLSSAVIAIGSGKEETGFGATVNDAFLYAGTVALAAGTSNAWHIIQSIANGTSSSITVDGTTTSPLSAGSSATGTPIGIGGRPSAGGNNFVGLETEEGFVAGVALSSTQLAALNANASAYGY